MMSACGRHNAVSTRMRRKNMAHWRAHCGCSSRYAYACRRTPRARCRGLLSTDRHVADIKRDVATTRARVAVCARFLCATGAPTAAYDARNGAHRRVANTAARLQPVAASTQAPPVITVRLPSPLQATKASSSGVIGDLGVARDPRKLLREAYVARSIAPLFLSPHYDRSKTRSRDLNVRRRVRLSLCGEGCVGLRLRVTAARACHARRGACLASVRVVPPSVGCGTTSAASRIRCATAPRTSAGHVVAVPRSPHCTTACCRRHVPPRGWCAAMRLHRRNAHAHRRCAHGRRRYTWSFCWCRSRSAAPLHRASTAPRVPPMRRRPSAARAALAAYCRQASAAPRNSLAACPLRHRRQV